MARGILRVAAIVAASLLLSGGEGEVRSPGPPGVGPWRDATVSSRGHAGVAASPGVPVSTATAPPARAGSSTPSAMAQGAAARGEARPARRAPAEGSAPGGAPATAPSAPGLADLEQRRADARGFLARLYRDFLGVEGEPQAIAMWADLLAAGTWTREQAVEHFLDSALQLEGAAPLARLYFAAFQRMPDPAGWAHWRSLVADGRPIEAISESFVSSNEFTSLHGGLDDAQFIDVAFRNTLGRAPTAGELAHWMPQVSSGLATRGRLLLSLSESPEFREAVANEVTASLLYSGLLGRTADAPGFAAWMRSMDEGMTRRAMITGFLESPEYGARVLPR